MTARGIDQILRHPGDPVLYEDWVVDARQYITLAEHKHGTIPRGVPDAWIWGIAIDDMASMAPDVRIVNLETAITTSDVPWPDKGIHYRMHPRNAGCLTAAGIDCCCLANNHVLDWGYKGLDETLRTLSQQQTGHAGAGRSRQEAQQPWIREIPGKGRVVTFCCGSPSSGIPQRWAADRSAPGVFLIDETDEAAPEELRQLIMPWRTDNTLIVVSLHWGGNWGYSVPSAQRSFAHALIDTAGVDVVFGHSSHHFRGLEVYRGRPVIYGAGDLITDYEGIDSHREFRGELGLMYFLTMDVQTRQLRSLKLTPVRMHRFQLTRPEPADIDWIVRVLNREGQPLGTSAFRHGRHHLSIHWNT
jgi:poly-gamma-glutamate synthesis protein (capsule biosynthesis protein)